MEHSFHGRTMGALSVTGNPHYREAFEPGIGNIRFATMNDIDSVKALINEKPAPLSWKRYRVRAAFIRRTRLSYGNSENLRRKGYSAYFR